MAVLWRREQNFGARDSNTANRTADIKDCIFSTVTKSCVWDIIVMAVLLYYYDLRHQCVDHVANSALCDTSWPLDSFRFLSTY